MKQSSINDEQSKYRLSKIEIDGQEYSISQALLEEIKSHFEVARAA